eukprot:scpid85015/ scgid13754/ 
MLKRKRRNHPERSTSDGPILRGHEDTANVTSPRPTGTAAYAAGEATDKKKAVPSAVCPRRGRSKSRTSGDVGPPLRHNSRRTSKRQQDAGQGHPFAGLMIVRFLYDWPRPEDNKAASNSATSCCNSSRLNPNASTLGRNSRQRRTRKKPPCPCEKEPSQTTRRSIDGRFTSNAKPSSSSIGSSTVGDMQLSGRELRTEQDDPALARPIRGRFGLGSPHPVGIGNEHCKIPEKEETDVSEDYSSTDASDLSSEEDRDLPRKMHHCSRSSSCIKMQTDDKEFTSLAEVPSLAERLRQIYTRNQLSRRIALTA